MKCEKCGTEYEGNFCPNGCNSPHVNPVPNKKPIYKQWWFWLIIVVVICIIAFAAGGNNSETQPSAPSTEQTDSTANTPANSTEQTPEKEDNVYHAGESFEANGLKITYEKAEKWESSNMFLQPKDGKMYIRLYITAENVSNTDRYISSFEFSCYADGVTADSSYVGDDTFSSDTLSKGRKTNGYIYFEVPKDAKDIEVEYETSFWTDKKAILKVELN